jgi:predicted lipoprotein with Yx(FWY)xxD motif
MTPKPSGGRRRGMLAGTTVLVIAALAVLAVTALAASPKRTKPGTLNVARSVEVGSKHEAITVNGHGAAVYDLLPETTKHLLCTKANGCFQFWPPVTVSKGAKITKGAGLKGKVGTFTHGGITQLTLNGHPLYTFSEDKGKGEAHGDGLKTFGGTWHVLAQGAAGGSSSTTGTTTTGTTTTSTTSAPYPMY